MKNSALCPSDVFFFPTLTRRLLQSAAAAAAIKGGFFFCCLSRLCLHTLPRVLGATLLYTTLHHTTLPSPSNPHCIASLLIISLLARRMSIPPLPKQPKTDQLYPPEHRVQPTYHPWAPGHLGADQSPLGHPGRRSYPGKSPAAVAGRRKST